MTGSCGMSLHDLKNEVLTTLTICKRDEEATDVIRYASQKMKEKNVSQMQRMVFWNEIYDTLGEKKISHLEEETGSSADPVIAIARDRIEQILKNEKTV